jgi:HD-GYP domain-containing protein (c-di-GMP phosphodiesterase class II)
MKKNIPVEQLRVGMYVSLQGLSWLKHDFMRTTFLIEEEKVLRKILATGLKEVEIDTARGLDVEQDAAEQPEAVKDQPPVAGAPVRPLYPETSGADIRQAQKAFEMASKVVSDLMNDVRAGKSMDLEKARDPANQIIRSIDKSPHTMTAVTRIKNRDEYTFQHSVGVATLLASFARGVADYTEDQIEEITLGGIVHDIGKVNVPDNILNKPDKLTDEEFVLMRKHVEYSREILEEQSGFTTLQTDIALLHHEKPDGSGYPLGLKAEAISDIGAMGAIIDVYDALTTRRVYKEAWEPTQALKKMLEWGAGSFHQDWLMKFIRHLGVYPVGTWIILDSGRVGFVLSLNENKLKPVVYLKLDSKKRRLLDEKLDLSGATQDYVRGVVSPAQYGLEDDFLI